MLLAPDPLTFKILPWAPDTAWIIADMYLKDRTRMPFDTRQVMRNAIKKLEDLNYSFIAGLELEFYVFVIEDEKLSLSEVRAPAGPAGSEGNQPTAFNTTPNTPWTGSRTCRR